MPSFKDFLNSEAEKEDARKEGFIASLQRLRDFEKEVGFPITKNDRTQMWSGTWTEGQRLLQRFQPAKLRAALKTMEEFEARTGKITWKECKFDLVGMSRYGGEISSIGSTVVIRGTFKYKGGQYSIEYCYDQGRHAASGQRKVRFNDQAKVLIADSNNSWEKFKKSVAGNAR